MAEWWESLSTFQQIMFVIAVPSTVVMIIFLILMLIGIEGSESFDGADVGDVGSDVDSFNDEPLSSLSGLKIFTLRGVLAFLSIGGWAAYALSHTVSEIVAGILGLFCGAAAAYLMALAFKAAMRLESEGNLDYQNTIGKSGVIYVRVPKSRSGHGKVTLTAQERYLEIDAITDEDFDLTTGMSVEVVGLENESTVIVKRK